MLDRLPPFSLEAEQSVLGAMLIDSDAIIEVADLLKPADFYRQAHGIIYAAIVDLYEQQTPTDIVTVSERIERDGDIERIGGRSYLSSLTTLTPSAVHAEAYAKVVARKSTLRRMINAAGKISLIAYSDPDDEEGALDQATEEVYKISENRTRGKYRELKALLHEAYDRIDHLFSNKGEVIGIGTGLHDLDRMTQGFQPSDLIILAARPSVGKTSMALNIAEHAANKEGKRVAVFSLEMSEEQLVMRLLSATSGVDSQRLRSGFLEESDFAQIARAMGTLSDSSIYIDDTPSLSITELRTKARRMKAEVGVDLVIVDYLQLMHAPGAGGKDANRVQEVSAITRGLKQLARELNVPVIALSQLSRQNEENTEPRLSHLRESGSIEQDADLVMFLWRKADSSDDWQHSADPQDGEWINLKLAKHRNGPTGELQLWFRKSQTRFYQMEDRLS